MRRPIRRPPADSTCPSRRDSLRTRSSGFATRAHTRVWTWVCRYGTLIKLVDLIKWVGVDVDPAALDIARSEGIPCEVMDLTFDIGFKDQAFDAVMMTEVLEHLPYPSIIVREVHRILKKQPGSAYMGTVPLDYHLHRRWKVLRGKRLSGEQTHVHHFSFRELDHLLRFYFHEVAYLPLAGTAQRHPSWGLSYNLFVRDIAWVASSPKETVERWGLGKSDSAARQHPGKIPGDFPPGAVHIVGPDLMIRL